jgi:hypothetical protein
MKKLLYVHSNSCNEKYLSLILDNIKNLLNLTIVDLETYASRDIKYYNQFDVIIYNTFPHQFHFKKYNRDLIKKTDDLFIDFKGRKILFDSHDSGCVDAFSRFNDKSIPRIKAWPSYEMISQYNIIHTIPGGIGLLRDGFDTFFNELSTKSFDEWKSSWPMDKNINISYIVSYGYHDRRCMDYPTYISKEENNKFIRENTRDVLKKYDRVKTDMNRLPQNKFHNHLKTSLVSVSVPGWGEGCLRQYESPLYGCLNLLHESISNIKLLPHVDLIDGVDYISFNLENLHRKLDYIFDNVDKVNQIRYNGKTKLHEGFNIQKSSSDLFNAINNL